MAQFKIYFTLFSMGSLVVVWKVSGDPVCYNRQYFDDHNSKISRVDCNSDPKNIYMRFESRDDVTIGALLDGKLRTGQMTSKKSSEATEAVNTPTSKTIKETERATQTTWTNEMTKEETEEDTSEGTIPNTVNDGTEEKPFQGERTPKEAVTTFEKQPAITTAEQLTTTEEQPTTTTEEQPTTTAAGVTNSQAADDEFTSDSFIAATAGAQTCNYSPSVTLAAGDCKPGWSKYNSSCYLVIRAEKNWTDAKHECCSYGSHLVFIESDAENSFIIGLINSKLHSISRQSGVWLGLTKEMEGGWKWYDTPAEIPESGPRKVVEKPGQNQFCVRIRPTKNYQWEIKECGVMNVFICELEQ